jgi:entericidin B
MKKRDAHTLCPPSVCSTHTFDSGKTDMSRYLTFALALFALTLAACNTIAGAGEDISKGGQAITNSADKAK